MNKRDEMLRDLYAKVADCLDATATEIDIRSKVEEAITDWMEENNKEEDDDSGTDEE